MRLSVIPQNGSNVDEIVNSDLLKQSDELLGHARRMSDSKYRPHQWSN
jgi:hypothetical protein